MGIERSPKRRAKDARRRRRQEKNWAGKSGPVTVSGSAAESPEGTPSTAGYGDGSTPSAVVAAEPDSLVDEFDRLVGEMVAARTAEIVAQVREQERQLFDGFELEPWQLAVAARMAKLVESENEMPYLAVCMPPRWGNNLARSYLEYLARAGEHTGTIHLQP